MNKIHVVDSGYAVNINGTHLQGYVNATFEELTNLFGKNIGSGDKTTVEWALVIETPVEDWNTQDYSGDLENIIVTIYDWKMPSTPLVNYDWHVGGHDKRAVWYIQRLLDEYRKKRA